MALKGGTLAYSLAQVRFLDKTPSFKVIYQISNFSNNIRSRAQQHQFSSSEVLTGLFLDYWSSTQTNTLVE